MIVFTIALLGNFFVNNNNQRGKKMSTTKKYIAVDADDATTNDTIKMQNPDNEVHGTLYTKDSKDQQKDIREIFIKKDALDGIEVINDAENADPGFTLDTVVKQFNAMLLALKGTTTALAILLCGASVAFGANTEGKAKLRYIGANQYVVTNEVDGVFKAWESRDFNTFKTNALDRMGEIE